MSNNVMQNHNCTALMSDGRHFTDYRSRNRLHVEIMDKNNVIDSNSHRRFLQENGAKLMGLNNKYQEKRNLCAEQRLIHPDAFGNDKYWLEYKKKVGL
jgi:hypothetical protein